MNQDQPKNPKPCKCDSCKLYDLQTKRGILSYKNNLYLKIRSHNRKRELSHILKVEKLKPTPYVDDGDRAYDEYADMQIRRKI